MRLTRILSFLLGTVLFFAVVGVMAVWLVYKHFSEGLPNYYELASYNPPVVSRIYAGDGRLLAEYAVENRVFVPISAISPSANVPRKFKYSCPPANCE